MATSKKKTTKKVTARAPKKVGVKKKAPAKRTRADPLHRRFSKPDPEFVVRDINMKFGHGGPVIRPAIDAWDASDLRRPFGIPSLDVASGGGLVAGKVHQVDGPESTGKNFLLYQAMAQVQRNYGDKSCLAMACFESFIDKHFAQTCGCKIAMSEYDIAVTNRARKLRGEPPLTDEETAEAMDCPEEGTFHIFEGASEDVLGGIVRATEANIYQIIGIDSWDSMMTFQEEKTMLGDTPQVASPATLQTQWSKKVLDALHAIYRCPECGFSPLENKNINQATLNYYWHCPNDKCKWKGLDPYTEVNETTLYCIRQVRAKLNLGGGKQYGRAYKTGGAFSLQHLNTIRISLHPGSALRDNNVKIGKEVNWEISKAKAGAREGTTGSFTLYFDPIEIDRQGDMFAQCLKHDVITKEGGSYFSTPDIEMDKVHGKDNFLELMEQEPSLMDALREQLYVNAGLAHIRFK